MPLYLKIFVDCFGAHGNPEVSSEGIYFHFLFPWRISMASISFNGEGEPFRCIGRISSAVQPSWLGSSSFVLASEAPRISCWTEWIRKWSRDCREKSLKSFLEQGRQPTKADKLISRQRWPKTYLAHSSWCMAPSWLPCSLRMQPYSNMAYGTR